MTDYVIFLDSIILDNTINTRCQVHQRAKQLLAIQQRGEAKLEEALYLLEESESEAHALFFQVPPASCLSAPTNFARLLPLKSGRICTAHPGYQLSDSRSTRGGLRRGSTSELEAHALFFQARIRHM